MEVALQERIVGLQAELATCKAAARRRTRLLGALVAALALALGVVLSGDAAVQQAAARLAQALGFGGAVNDADAAYAAYQSGDYATARRRLRPLAERGDARSQLILGLMYADGRGVPQDYTEAARWYRLAADHGYAQAQYNLGLAYAKGEGVAQDNVAAHMWFNLAAARFAASDARNHELAVRNRDLVANKMSREQLAEAQNLAREWKRK